MHLLIPCLSAWCLLGHSRCERWGGRWTQPGRRGPAWSQRLQMDPRARKTEDAPRTSRKGNRVPLKHHRETGQLHISSLKMTFTGRGYVMHYLSFVVSRRLDRLRPHHASLGPRGWTQADPPLRAVVPRNHKAWWVKHLLWILRSAPDALFLSSVSFKSPHIIKFHTRKSL